MPRYALYAIDPVAVGLLVFGLYLPRHRRRDLGLGLFGVLSIIRLRSTELDQHEVAYYFSALALGIIGPLSSASSSRPVYFGRAGNSCRDWSL